VAGLLASLMLASVLPMGSPAASATTTSVTMSLSRQTPWVTPKNLKIALAVSVTNSGPDALSGLSVVTTLNDAVNSRSEYDLSLTQDVTPPIQNPQTISFDGTIDPGTTRTLSMTVPVPGLAGRTSASLIYPLTVDFVSGTTIEAEVRTPVIYIVKKPKTPLNLAWSWVLGSQICFTPDGTFTCTGLLRSLQSDGAIYSTLQSLRSMAGPKGPPIDVSVAPMLLQQLSMMSEGFAVQQDGATVKEPSTSGSAVAAATALQAMRSIAAGPHVELSAMPYSSPNLPSLLASGLGKDIPLQLSMGNQLVSDLAGAGLDTTILRPPGSGLDEATAGRLRAAGVRTLIVNPATVPLRPQPNGFAQPAVVHLATGAHNYVSLVQPDAGVQAMIDSTVAQDDPRLAAQQVLGELASIWMEQPSDARGSAILIDTAWNLPPTFTSAIAGTVSRAPWLQLHTDNGLVALADKFSPPAQDVSRLPIQRNGSFPQSYVASIANARAQVASWASMLTRPSSTPKTLSDEIMVSEAGQYLKDVSAGGAWTADAAAKATRSMSQVHALPSQVITLASATGNVPVRIANTSGQPLKVQVGLESPRLRFSSANPQQVILRYPEQTLIFRATAQTTGTFPVQIQITTPSGRHLPPQTLVVRSRAFSRLALIITFGALAFLLLVWARRAWKRQRT
jgi:hypothetical protein